MAFHCGVGIHIPQQDEHHPAYGYILPTTGWIRDFNPLETCAARRTYRKPDSIKNEVRQDIIYIRFHEPLIQILLQNANQFLNNDWLG